MACILWVNKWCRKEKMFNCDNLATVEIINNGRSKVSSIMKLMRKLTYYSDMYSYAIPARQIPGVDNIHARHILVVDNIHVRHISGVDNMHVRDIPGVDNIHVRHTLGVDNIHARHTR